MKVTIIAMGRLQKGPHMELIENYQKRLPWPVTIKELDIKKPAQRAEDRKAQEAEKLLQALPPAAAIIALDERGKDLSSRQLASKIENFQDSGIKDLAFFIGGADGLDASIRSKAHLVLGLGNLTWPHMMVRSMLMEQIYRSWSILNNHPYHRD